MNSQSSDQQPVWQIPALYWLVLVVGLVLAVFASYEGVVEMVRRWGVSEEYGYGYLIPIVTLFLIWQRKNKLEALPFTGSWPGFMLLVSGVLITLVGQLSTLHSITQYGFIVTVIGGVYAIMGWTAFRIVLIPLLLLFLMVPLPGFVFNNLSFQLQLISSQIGVAVIRLFGVSVYLEGNVIDLGTYKLQVVEACSGLRYLFPLLALSIIASYFYQAAIWKRIVMILSSIPITVLMNSFRIGVIGVLVEYGGPEQAEGFLHDFEGWIVFMACVALLVLEMWLLSFIGKDRRPFREVFGMELPEPTPADVPVVSRSVPLQALVAIVLLVTGTAGAMVVSGRTEVVTPRPEFATFPLNLDGWNGRNDTLESVVLDVLKLDDYLMADYRNADGEAVSFYVAYYGSQRSGASTHSPRTCLPGGGWKIESHEQVMLDGGWRVNRFVISLGEYRQIVYYWFKQRDRILTNEFAVKAYLVWDALARSRTDGALVRLTTVLTPDEDVEAGDARLRDFAAVALPQLTDYIPD